MNMALLVSSKWITPVCSWELSNQERYVIFMKNKEIHGVKPLYSCNYVIGMCITPVTTRSTRKLDWLVSRDDTIADWASIERSNTKLYNSFTPWLSWFFIKLTYRSWPESSQEHTGVIHFDETNSAIWCRYCVEWTLTKGITAILDSLSWCSTISIGFVFRKFNVFAQNYEEN